VGAVGQKRASWGARFEQYGSFERSARLPGLVVESERFQIVLKCGRAHRSWYSCGTTWRPRGRHVVPTRCYAGSFLRIFEPSL
jgi:hypothetical protein